VVNGNETTRFVGTHYEVTGSDVTKYYPSAPLRAGFAGSQRIAMRSKGEVFYMLGDHLGSTSVTTDAAGQVIAEQRYTACPLRFASGMLREGETRYESGVSQSAYTYTGQYSYTEDFGLHFYNARWYDSQLGRFVQADTIIPEQTQGVQAWDRYAYTNNNPVKYVDPSGRCPMCITAAFGAVIGAVVGAATVAVPQMINNARNDQPLMTNINPTEVAKAATVGAIAGGVAGLTFGIGTAMLGTGLGASVIAGAGSGVVSGQVARAADNAVNGRDVTEGLLNPKDMATDAVMGAAGGAVSYGIGRLFGSATTGKAPSSRVPNPDGRLGGPAHRAVVNSIDDALAESLYGKGSYVRYEFKINTPGGVKPYRFADAAILGPNGQPQAFYQVGRITQGGSPVARELRAISDIFNFSKYNVPITFLPYFR
jgi:RHS repeat-associated protein